MLSGGVERVWFRDEAELSVGGFLCDDQMARIYADLFAVQVATSAWEVQVDALAVVQGNDEEAGGGGEIYA